MKASIVAAAILVGFAPPAYTQQQPQSQQPQDSSQQESVPVLVRKITVIEIQRKLNDEGFNVGQADGDWGPQTESALKNYQQQHGMSATGQLDPATLEAMEIVLIPVPAMGGTTPQAGGSGENQPQR
jgi:peptidoglycan hydrolase-like protein with peptidoglycan-binding domain